jgi:branched-chain amino acid transport system ATP-binding protein
MTEFLQVTGLSKRFGGVRAVEDLSFDVRPGEIVGLIGPNGAGKSTAFNLINGVIKPDSGTVIFDGEDITGLRSDRVARRGIARAHQIVQPLLGMTIMENCLVGACFGRENLSVAAAEGAVLDAAALTGLSDRLEEFSSTLTTAGKKRLELARALAARPRLLLLDEVLAGLNPREVAAMVPVIRALAERGITILMIEHVMQAVMRLAEHVFVLAQGRIIAEGPPQAVVDDATVVEAYLGRGAAARLSAAGGAHV